MKVDSSSGQKGEIHVTYDDVYGYTPYHAMLNISDIGTGINKFYRMQVIKMNNKNYNFFISWGRIGDEESGDSRVYKHGEKGAVEAFEEKFLEKTGVDWADRDIFQKKPGKYFMADLDDGWEEVDLDEQPRKKLKLETAKDESKEEKKGPISERVQSLINLIFDKKKKDEGKHIEKNENR